MPRKPKKKPSKDNPTPSAQNADMPSGQKTNTETITNVQGAKDTVQSSSDLQTEQQQQFEKILVEIQQDPKLALLLTAIQESRKEASETYKRIETMLQSRKLPLPPTGIAIPDKKEPASIIDQVINHPVIGPTIAQVLTQLPAILTGLLGGGQGEDLEVDGLTKTDYAKWRTAQIKAQTEALNMVARAIAEGKHIWVREQPPEQGVP